MVQRSTMIPGDKGRFQSMVPLKPLTPTSVFIHGSSRSCQATWPKAMNNRPPEATAACGAGA